MFLRFLLSFFFLFFLTICNAANTYITGDQMEIKQGGRYTVFNGNATVVHKSTVFRANRIVQDKIKNKIEAFGNVILDMLTKDLEPIHVKSERAFYDINNEYGELLEGRPEINYIVKDSSENLKLIGEIIKLNGISKIIDAQGNVEIISSSISAVSQFARFFQDDNKIILWGDPYPMLVSVSNDGTGNFSSENIMIYPNKKKIIFKDNVHAILKYIKNE